MGEEFLFWASASVMNLAARLVNAANLLVKLADWIAFGEIVDD